MTVAPVNDGMRVDQLQSIKTKKYKERERERETVTENMPKNNRFYCTSSCMSVAH